MIIIKRNRALQPKRLGKKFLRDRHVWNNGKGIVNLTKKSLYKPLYRKLKKHLLA